MRSAPLRRPWLPVLLFAGLAASSSAVAAGPWNETHIAMPMQARHAVSLDQAIAMAERQFRARVVRAGVDESNGQRAYVLRLVSEQGRVWTVRVDAQTGSIY
ncbi:MAG: PepSY domain-containing protein [Steroidobacteraceae bacterium]